MPVDVEFIEAHRRIDRPDAGVSEEFTDLVVDDDRMVATLYRPLEPGPPAATGWVLCHSLGFEQTTLMEHEVAAARAIAAAGMPVLRYQGRGYGDSEGGPFAVGLDSHLADAAEAVGHLGDQDGIERVGVVGGRFGGLVAALTAERRRLPLMVLWEPVVDGARCIRELLRSTAIREMARALQRAGGRRPAGPPPGRQVGRPDPEADFLGRGWADVGGFVLTEDARSAISAVDLRAALRRFDGRALVVTMAKAAGQSSQEAEELVGHLRALGGGCDRAEIVDDQAAHFGQVHHGRIEDGRPKSDLQARLEAALANTTAGWCRLRATSAGDSSAPDDGGRTVRVRSGTR